MGIIRKIRQGLDALNSAAVVNRPHEDVLSISRYPTDGTGFNGFAQTQEGSPVVADGNARDALFPAPIFNQGVNNIATGYIERWDGARWQRVTPTGFAGPEVRVLAQGAYGDGIQDDYAALARVEALIAPGGIAAGIGIFDPGTYNIGTSITLRGHYAPRPGVRLRPLAGVIITILGPITAGMWQWMDWSGGGTFSFVGNHYIADYVPQWTGVKGDDATDDSAALQALVNVLPDWGSARFASFMKMKVQYLTLACGRSGITLWTEGWPLELYGGNIGTMFRWTGVPGGIMLGFYNCGFCTVRGFMFDGGTAGCMLDFDEITIGTTAGLATITSNAQPNGTVGAGPAIFTSLAPNCPIVLGQAGPASANLTTTIASVQDATHATLATPASQTFSQTCPPAFGVNAQSPALRITTQCMVLRNRFVGGIGTRTTTCLRLSQTALTNVECFLIRENYMCGNGNVTPGHFVPYLGANVRTMFGGPFQWTPPSGGGITAGTNDFLGFSADIFTAEMDGLPILIARAGAAYTGGLNPGGPNNGPAQLNGFIKWIGDARHVKIVDAGGAALNAGTSAPAPGYVLAFQIDQAMGTGLRVGYSQEPHHQVLENNMYFSLNIGADLQGGSHHEWMGQYSDNEINKWMGNRQANPSTAYGTNCESSRMHLFIQPTSRYSERGSRVGVILCSPGAGFITVFGGGPTITFEDMQFEGDVYNAGAKTGSAIYDLSKSAGQTIISKRVDYLMTTPTSLTETLEELGWLALPGNTAIHTQNDSPVYLPSEATLIDPTLGVFSQPVKRHLGTGVYLNLPQVAPSNSDFLPGMREALPFYEPFGGADHVRYFPWYVMHADGVGRVHNVPQFHQKRAGFGAAPDLANGLRQLVGTIALPGVVPGDQVIVGIDQAMAGSEFYGRVLVNDQVNLYQFNNTGADLLFQSSYNASVTVIHFDTF